MREMTPLCKLARKHMTDKGGRHNVYNNNFTETCHEYTPLYWDLLHKKAPNIQQVLEIGINGGCSLRMWREFFPSAEIIGLDIDRNYLFQDDHIHSIWADQGDASSLMRVMTALPNPFFDLIIDDGSHDVDHQVISARTLMPFVKKGGLYVIEDLTIDHAELVKKIDVNLDIAFVAKGYPCEPGIGKAETPEKLLVFHVY